MDTATYTPPPWSWDTINDVEPAEDDVIYFAIHSYDGDGKYWGQLTGYDLSQDVALEVVRSHNEALGLWQDEMGRWYE